jgi:NitT/TauT family transport system permease protein
VNARPDTIEAAEQQSSSGRDSIAAAEAAATRHHLTIRIAQIGVGVAFLAFWQFASGPLIDPFFVSSPVAVLTRLGSWIGRGLLWHHAAYTFTAMGIGFVCGALSGFLVGFAFGRSALLASVFDPYITAVFCLPKIALAPVLIMWFGIGIESKIAMASVIVFFLVFLNSYAGVRDVSPIHIHTTRIMGASEWQLLRFVILPSAAAWVLTGLKISVPYALIGAVVGEMISSNRGIGFLIGQAAGLFDTAGVFAGLSVLAAAGIILNAALKRVEKQVLRWRGAA